MSEVLLVSPLTSVGGLSGPGNPRHPSTLTFTGDFFRYWRDAVLLFQRPGVHIRWPMMNAALWIESLGTNEQIPER